MPTPDQAVELRARIARTRAVRALHEAVHAFAWRALRRYRLSDADRKDVAQNVVIAAFQRRDAYRADRGAPGAWLWGLLRNEVRAFARGQRPELAGDEALDAASDAPTPEERVAVEELADHLLDLLPIDERRAVMLHEMFGLTFRDIAKLEGISPTQAHARHRAGREALRIAVARWKQAQEHRGIAFFPVTLASILDPHRGLSGPPPGVEESAWRSLVSQLGLGVDLDDPELSESEPPESGPRRCEARPATDGTGPPSRPRLGARFRWLRLLGPVAGASLGGLVGGAALDRCSDRGHEQPAPVTATATATLIESPQSAAASTAETSPAVASVSSTAAPPAPEPRPIPRRPAAPRDDGAVHRDADAERALVDRARSALASENLAGGLAALAEHAERFPQGRHAAARDRLWAQGCAQARSAHARGETPEMDARCAGQP